MMRYPSEATGSKGLWRKDATVATPDFVRQYFMQQYHRIPHDVVAGSAQERSIIEGLVHLRDSMRAGQMIYIGSLPPEDRLRDMANRAYELIKAGYIKAPFEGGRYTVVFNTWPVGDMPEQTRVMYVDADGDSTANGWFVASCFRSPTKVEAIPHMVIKVIARPFGDYDKKLSYMLGEKDDDLSEMAAPAADYCNVIALYTLMLLNTENVPAETTAVSPKLNRARMKAGKDPLPPYTTIHSKEYVTAVTNRRYSSEHQGGTHRSPVAHIRRGHVRRLADGKQIWIRDTLVNGRKGDVARRAFYQIKT